METGILLFKLSVIQKYILLVWLAQIFQLILYNQLALTKFGRRLRYRVIKNDVIWIAHEIVRESDSSLEALRTKLS